MAGGMIGGPLGERVPVAASYLKQWMALPLVLSAAAAPQTA
eukprot:COSAG01_NODE_4176_length_5267_cov_34.739164_5_plen_41_part_00